MCNIVEQLNKIQNDSIEKVLPFNAVTNIKFFKDYIFGIVEDKFDFRNLIHTSGKIKKETTFSREEIYDDEF